MDAIGNLKDPAIRDYVYSRLSAGGGRTTKQTAAGRLRDLDEIVVSLARSGEPNIVHDIGVSSGVTSLDLFSTLQGRKLPVSFYISDKYARYAATGQSIVRIVDADGALVEMYVARVLAKRDVSKYFFLTRLLYWLFASLGAQNPAKWFLLYDPEVIDRIDRGVMHHVDYDVFETRMPSQFTFVRCMNLLNMDRFAPTQIEHALKNIVLSLKDSGVLQVGRTMADGHNTAAFYLKTDKGLRLLKEVGGGTELRDLLTRL
jgi:hypothetical protein